MKKIASAAVGYIRQLMSSIVDNEKRLSIVFPWVNRILMFVSLVMSVVNIFTHEYKLMISTLAYAVLCLINSLLTGTKINQIIVHIVFSIEALTLLAFFYISGVPDGFSALWICLIPSFALFVFGKKGGGIFSCSALAMLIFFFWTPYGRSILMFDYNETFMLRFPFIYIAIMMISFLVEYVRSETHNKLCLAQEEYRNLCNHDALTGILNRYGFQEAITEVFERSEKRRVAMIIFDIDDFKIVNDRYGHDAGDEALKTLATLTKNSLCKDCEYCRWGGEEFLVCMWCEHDPIAAAETLRRTIEQSVIKYEDMELRITLSIGVCIAPDITEVTASHLIKQADKCLYLAKDNGKNRVEAIVLE